MEKWCTIVSLPLIGAIAFVESIKGFYTSKTELNGTNACSVSPAILGGSVPAAKKRSIESSRCTSFDFLRSEYGKTEYTESAEWDCGQARGD
jgi:hypothetical protein